MIGYLFSPQTQRNPFSYNPNFAQGSSPWNPSQYFQGIPQNNFFGTQAFSYKQPSSGGILSRGI